MTAPAASIAMENGECDACGEQWSNGESPGVQDASISQDCSQSIDRGRGNGAMEALSINGCGLRTMEPENNLMVFERGSLGKYKYRATFRIMPINPRNLMCREVKFVILYYFQLNPKTTSVKAKQIRYSQDHCSFNSSPNYIFVLFFNCFQRLRSSAMLYHLDLLSLNQHQ